MERYLGVSFPFKLYMWESDQAFDRILAKPSATLSTTRGRIPKRPNNYINLEVSKKLRLLRG
jgi:hypothetical protein